MKIAKNTLLKIIYEPKQLLLSRVGICLMLVCFLAVAWVYVRHIDTVEQQDLAEQHGKDDPNLIAMQAHIESLNSRIKHLSLDNKRLSTTGHKLSQQLRNTSSTMKEQLVHTKELQLELYSLDQHLISKYDNFIELQKVFSEARLECDKEKDKVKSKKCINYTQVKQDVEDLISQIKFLKAKREVLLSELDRTAA